MAKKKAAKPSAVEIENKARTKEQVISEDVCQNCERKSKSVIPLGETMPLPGTKAERCNGCGRVGSKAQTFTYNKKKVTYKAAKWKEVSDRSRYPLGGYYDDFHYYKNDRKIKNPFAKKV